MFTISIRTIITCVSLSFFRQGCGQGKFPYPLSLSLSLSVSLAILENYR